MGIIEESKKLYQDSQKALTDRLKIAIDEIHDGDYVLEVGVGWGELASHIHKHKHIRLYAVDASESALKEIRSAVADCQLVDISSAKMKFSDNQFDSVVCLEVFEHLQNPYFALLEIQRVLKPGGRLIMSIPNPYGGHIMIYPGLISAKHFRLFLRQNFFKVKKYCPWGPVFNKDNIGEWLTANVKIPFLVSIFLRIVQISVRILQILTRLLGLKISALFWCYIFVCENKKEDRNKPFWLRQLEQTLELGNQYKGWYNAYFHRKA